MNGAGFQKGLTCESCHSEFQRGIRDTGGEWGVCLRGSSGIYLLTIPCLHAPTATQSAQWYAWGPPNMQCRLCASCWIYWKKYGGLKTPTQLEGAARGTTVRMDEGQVGESSELIDVSFRRRPEHPAPVR